MQRYERDLGLPVRRPAEKPCGSVVATKPELDGWIAASPVRAAFRLRGPQDTITVLDQFRSHMREARRLRLESAELRASLHESFELLHRTLRTAMPATSRQGPQDHNSILDASERRVLAEVLTFDPRKKKVN